MYPLRREALRARLRAEKLDALLVTDLVNIRYLTGFTGSNGALLVHSEGEEQTVFCTDGR
ncbi:MAG: aminopeptidase P family N-terminal domain-containing protein, partial [Pseudonocardiaceae bacterium]